MRMQWRNDWQNMQFGFDEALSIVRRTLNFQDLSAEDLAAWQIVIDGSATGCGIYESGATTARALALIAAGQCTRARRTYSHKSRIQIFIIGNGV